MANITALPSPTANPVPGVAVGTGQANSRFSENPLLVPDFYTPVEINGVVVRVSPNDLLSQPGYARAAASATATVSSVSGATDAVTVTFTNGVLKNSGGARTVSAVAGVTASDTSLAEAIVAAINADPVLNAFQILASNADAVVTISQNGPVGNFTTVSFAATSGAPVLTFSPVSGTLAGGSGSVWPFNTFTYTYGGQTFWIRSRVPTVIPQPILAAMVRDGMSIS